MSDGDEEEVDTLECSPSPGDSSVICLFLKRIALNNYEFSLQTPQVLGHTEDFLDSNDDGTYLEPEKIDGEFVRGQMGDYWVGYNYLPYQDQNNSYSFVEDSFFNEPNYFEWKVNHGDIYLNRFVDNDEIDKSNVNELYLKTHFYFLIIKILQ